MGMIKQKSQSVLNRVQKTVAATKPRKGGSKAIGGTGLAIPADFLAQIEAVLTSLLVKSMGGICGNILPTPASINQQMKNQGIVFDSEVRASIRQQTGRLAFMQKPLLAAIKAEAATTTVPETTAMLQEIKLPPHPAPPLRHTELDVPEGTPEEEISNK